MARVAGGSILLLVMAACSGAAPAPTAGPLPTGVIAMCAGETIQAGAISALAARRKISPREAVDILCRDARLAVAAKQRLPPSYLVQSARRAALARATMYEVRASQGYPPTKTELDEIRKLHWAELDHDEAVETTHAVAIADAADATARVRAKEVATKILESVRGSSSIEDFIQRAQAVERGGIDVRVERLPAVTRDGRVLSAEAGEFDPGFARGANELKKPGDISGLIESSFGFHVIRLSERVEAFHLSDDELAKTVKDEVTTNRTRKALDQLLGELRKKTPVDIERSFAQTLTRLDRSTP